MEGLLEEGVRFVREEFGFGGEFLPASEIELRPIGIWKWPFFLVAPLVYAVNPDVDLANLIQGLKRRPEVRLCLYGPPGTGKTEFGHYLAQQLDKRLVVRRASDILDKYVGGTEANIAEMFSEAKRENAVLLLDEADSFLRDKNHARQSWEITQVNELLTQMEAYDGIFICSTNLMK